MNYSQYVEQHQQLTDQFEAVAKEFEGLRETYDKAAPEARSDLEPALKDSMNRVESARADLSALESQEPKQEPEQEPEQKLEVDVFEVASGISDVAEKFSTFKEAITALAMLGNVYATDLPLDPILEPSPSIQSEQPAEPSQDIGKDLQDLARSPKEQKEEIAEQMNEFRESVQSYDDAYENANGRSGEDILVQNESELPNLQPDSQHEMKSEITQEQSYTAPDYDTAMSERMDDIHAGIAQGKGFANAVNDANENLYAKVTGEAYNGSPEDLSESLTQAIAASYGSESKQAFEQANAPQQNLQQQQEEQQNMTY